MVHDSDRTSRFIDPSIGREVGLGERGEDPHSGELLLLAVRLLLQGRLPRAHEVASRRALTVPLRRQTAVADGGAEVVAPVRQRVTVVVQGQPPVVPVLTRVVGERDERVIDGEVVVVLSVSPHDEASVQVDVLRKRRAREHRWRHDAMPNQLIDGCRDLRVVPLLPELEARVRQPLHDGVESHCCRRGLGLWRMGLYRKTTLPTLNDEQNLVMLAALIRRAR